MKKDKAWYTPAMLLFLNMLIIGSLQAKTVALWKLDFEPLDTTINTRCMIDPANDLTVNGVAVKGESEGDWSIPPNPDTTENMLDDPSSKNAVFLSANGSDPRTSLTSSTFGSKVNITNSFTVEGWMKRKTNPGTWQYVVGAHMGGEGRWILSLRDVGGLKKWVLYVNPGINDVPFPVADSVDTTNVWRHIALSYDREAGSAQQGVWELFIDSQSYGALTNATRPSTISTADSIFSLGGRPTALNMADESLDYWRVSDMALTTNEFLNAGTVTPVTPTNSPTFAYWRLDGDANGTMNAEDFIGGAHLSDNIDAIGYTTTIQPATTQAFEGQPPNSAVALPDGNAGSIYGQGNGACLRTSNLGYQLEITNSFTVEGWICPRRSDYNAAVQYIANTRISTKGWAFALKKLNDDTLKLVIFAEDDGGVQMFDAPISGDLTEWADTWKHVALVYDATAGSLSQGVWNCYLDGIQQGSVTNGHVVSGDSASQYFHLGGRVGTDYTFSGFMDCWRASKAALTPSQFMNATNSPAAATDVLALWPLNSSNGIYLDATDVVGTFSFNTPVASTYKVTANTDQAVTNMPNPETSTTFKGNPALNPGSIIFNTPAETASKAYLSSTDINLRNILCLTNSFTFEGWFYRTKNPGNWQILFATGSAPSFTSGGMTINMTYRSNGYVLFVSPSGINDVAFSGTTDDLTLNVWRHMALVYDVSAGNGTWSLYINGILQGTIENSSVPARTTASCVYVGGRPWSANSFYGAMDAVRLTRGVLSTNEFLNFAVPPPTPVAPHTVAYWKLDSDGTTLDASSQVEPRYSFITDSFIPTGTTDQFKPLVPTPDTTPGFIGDPKANAGSAAFSSDYLRIQNLGNRVELDNAFTVEGWMKWNNDAATEVQTIAGTRFDTDYGWRLTLEKSGSTAAFRIFCQTPTQSQVLDSVLDFDASILADDWHHLALTYTPLLNDNGTWELFVDGSSVGTAVNRFYTTVLQQSHWFMLGGTSGGAEGFDGLLDCWRITDGTLTPDQFMYLGYERGTLILIQ